MVLIATQIGQVDRQYGRPVLALRRRQIGQIVECRPHAGQVRQRLAGTSERLGRFAIQRGQRQQGIAQARRKIAGQRLELRHVLRGQCPEQLALDGLSGRHALDERFEHTGVAQIDADLLQTGKLETVKQQFLDLEIGFEPAVPKDLGTDLEWLARRQQITRTRK